jgi:hypothetical protein
MQSKMGNKVEDAHRMRERKENQKKMESRPKWATKLRT